MKINVFYMGNKRSITVDGVTPLMDILEMNTLPTSGVEISMNGNRMSHDQMTTYIPVDGDDVNIRAGKQASGC